MIPVQELRLDPPPLVNSLRQFVMFANCKCAGSTMKRWFISSLDIERSLREPCLRSLHGEAFANVVSRDSTGLYRCSTGDLLGSLQLTRFFLDLYGQDYCLPRLHSGIPSEWFRFAVVRNPFDRVVSAFVDKFCGPDASTGWVQREIAYATGKGNTVGTISFAQFLEYLARSPEPLTNRHWRRQTFITEGYDIHQYVHVETLHEDMSIISDVIGMPIATTILDSKEQSNIYGRSDGVDGAWAERTNFDVMIYRVRNGHYPAKSSFYNTDTAARVSELYAADFRAFGYENRHTPFLA